MLNSLSSAPQKDAVAVFRFAPPTRATTCASVMNEPSTVQSERGVLGLHVEREASSREEVVEATIAASKVRPAPVSKQQVRVL